MPRGRNRDFLVCGIKAIFKKNWHIDIDSHEIDLKLTYGENFNELYCKYILLKFDGCDLC